MENIINTDIKSELNPRSQFQGMGTINFTAYSGEKSRDMNEDKKGLWILTLIGFGWFLYCSNLDTSITAGISSMLSPQSWINTWKEDLGQDRAIYVDAKIEEKYFLKRLEPWK